MKKSNSINTAGNEIGRYLQYKSLIKKMMEELNEDDLVFWGQMYTIFKCHMERKKNQ